MSLKNKKSSPIEHYNGVFDELKNLRSPHEKLWKELRDHLAPGTGHTLLSDKKLNVKLPINNIGILSFKKLVRAVNTLITNPAQPWFDLSPQGETLENEGVVKEWIEIFVDFIRSVLHEADFYPAMFTTIREIFLTGTGGMILLEDFDNVVRPIPLITGGYFLGVNNKDEVDVFAREYEMTVKNIVAEFGKENVSESTLRMYKDHNLKEIVKIRHIVEPVSELRFKYSGNDFKLHEDMKFRSVEYEVDQSTYERHQLLRVRGFKTFPVAIARPGAEPGSPYGRSDMINVLGDLKQLELLEINKADIIDKLANPPLQVPANMKDVDMAAGAINILQGSVSGVKIEPIHSQFANLASLVAEQEAIESRIIDGTEGRTIMVHTLQDTAITATATREKQAEKLTQLGSINFAIQGGILTPIINRTSDIAFDHAKLGWEGLTPEIVPQPPEQLSGQKLKVEYVSILARAQRTTAIEDLQTFVGLIGQVAQIDPNVLTQVNLDEVIREAIETLGITQKSMKSAEELQAILEQQAQQEQMMVEQQQQAEGVDQMSKLGALAKSLGDTEMSGNNALGQLSEGLSGVQGGVQ